MLKQLIASSILATAVLANTSFAFELKGTPQEKGLAIAEESERRNTGWQDSRATMKMILKNKAGETSERDISIKSLEVENDGDKSLTVFNSPRDVKGTAFLSFSHAVTPDEQWLYLPALKRVKRIASKNKSGPFMGSEFAFEDLSSFEVEKYSYQYLGEEKVNGLNCYKSELKPAYKHSGYSRTITWIDQEEFRIQKIEYYDRKNQLLKTQTFHDYKLYLDQYWRAHKMMMTNHQVGKSTELLWSDFEFKTGLNDKSFNKNSLKRAR